MANPFDQFDSAQGGGNPFNQFDEPQAPESVEQVQAEPQQTQQSPQDQGMMGRVNEAILNLPGGSTLAELAAASNRTMFDVLDFFGPDNVNAVLELAGSEKRVPTFGGSMASEGGYMEPGLGRDVVRSAGEVLPLAAGGGAAVRGAAGRLPAFSQGEGAAVGTVRQLGASTAGQDVATGLASGAGAAVGQEFGGPVGETIGAVAGGMATGLPAVARGAKSAFEGRAADKLFAKAAPTPKRLRSEAGKIYQALDEMGVTVKQPEVESLATNITSTIKNSGFNATLHPKVAAVLQEVAETGQSSQSLRNLENLRRIANTAASSVEPDEKRLGSIIIDKIDDFLDDVPADALQGADQRTVGSLYKEARNLWGKARRSELIEEALDKADLQASGLENGIRVQLRSLLNNKKKMRGFSAEERAAMRQVVEGTTPANVFKALGRLGVSEGQATNMLTGSLGMAGGGALGASVGGPIGAGVGAAGMLAVGQGARKAAQNITKSNVKLADAIVRSKGNGREIARAYMRTTPEDQRNLRELTGLLLEPGVNIKPLRSIEDKFISDAAFAAGMIKAAQESEQEPEDNDTNQNQ